jgi:hypothetical protein
MFRPQNCRSALEGAACHPMKLEHATGCMQPTSCGLSPYRRVLGSLYAQLRHIVFKESFAQIAWAELKTQKWRQEGPARV